MNNEIKVLLENRNKRIIEAVIQKAKSVCPESLALIGVYGSFCTGDIYEKSDLDLLIVINDNDGWKLGTGFIQGGVGHDIYCTSWEGLENDAKYNNAYISKLMESKIVYCDDEKYMERLEQLRNQVKQTLSTPFSKEDLEKAQTHLDSAITEYARIMMNDNVGKCKYYLTSMLYNIENAICMLNKRYFKLGVKRIREELDSMEKKPQGFMNLYDKIVRVDSIDEIKKYSTDLINMLDEYFTELKQSLIEKQDPTPQNLKGSYEEMFSNWRNKMFYAAENNDIYLSLMTSGSLQQYFDYLYETYNIPRFDVMSIFNPNDLYRTAIEFDNTLERYHGEYDKVGLRTEQYETIDDFEKHYLGK